MFSNIANNDIYAVTGEIQTAHASRWRLRAKKLFRFYSDENIACDNLSPYRWG